MSEASVIPAREWQWFGSPGHFICGRYCQFHLCTRIGNYLVSTVGEYVPDSKVREVLAEARGVVLEGRGDMREADWMKKMGFQEIGADRTYETMVFAVSGERCDEPGCACGLPTIIPTELDFEGYNRAAEAAKGHLALCLKWADASQRAKVLTQ